MSEDLDEDFDFLDVKKMNETEVRLFNLLFNLIKEPKGISFQKIRRLLPRHYHNEDIESDRKKLYRDLNQLKSLGFNIKVSSFGYQSEDLYPYYIEKESATQTLRLDESELRFLSLRLSREDLSQDENLRSLAQKLFYGHLDLFPKGAKPFSAPASKNKEEESNLSKILQALKDKRAISILYGWDTKERIIEPYRLIRKKTEDVYLLAYDRGKKEIRTFVISRIVVKRELKEEFLSNLKISQSDTNLQPLSFHFHDKKRIRLSIQESYLESFIQSLQAYPYQIQDNILEIETTNEEALFPFFLKYPEALQKDSDPIFIKNFQTYTNQLLESYLVAK
ncbi:WYL domain protein [Leptospira ryugenii]|uniref:WYL domain protein n=1 Tax=Leptospira ryugenii TaxID=1917863 RepID=A0A2P2DZP4_9LEPT|nr:WYL domain-containing protein [Leptospira ryugenii]GBF50046.1 WYL domain protein [Leptospira ryugenii]